MNIEIYGSNSCKFCESAKTLCKQNGLGFTYVDLTPQEARESFQKIYGFMPRTVPQISVDGKMVGSFDAFKAYLTAEID